MVKRAESNAGSGSSVDIGKSGSSQAHAAATGGSASPKIDVVDSGSSSSDSSGGSGSSSYGGSSRRKGSSQEEAPAPIEQFHEIAKPSMPGAEQIRKIKEDGKKEDAQKKSSNIRTPGNLKAPKTNLSPQVEEEEAIPSSSGFLDKAGVVNSSSGEIIEDVILDELPVVQNRRSSGKNFFSTQQETFGMPSEEASEQIKDILSDALTGETESVPGIPSQQEESRQEERQQQRQQQTQTAAPSANTSNTPTEEEAKAFNPGAKDQKLVDKLKRNLYSFARRKENSTKSDKQHIFDEMRKRSRILTGKKFDGYTIPQTPEEKRAQQSEESTDRLEKIDPMKNRIEEAVYTEQVLYINGYLPLESGHLQLDSFGREKLEHGSEMKEVLQKISDLFDCSQQDVFRTLITRLGISVDTHKDIMDHESIQDWDLPLSIVQRTYNLMVEGIKRHNNPFAYVQGEKIRFGNVERFPVMPTYELCEAMWKSKDSVIHDSYESAFDFMEACRKDWIERTKPNIELRADQNQKFALYTMAGALLDISNYQYGGKNNRLSAFGISHTIDRTAADILEDNAERIKNETGRLREVAQDVAEDRERQLENLRKKKVKQVEYPDLDGNLRTIDVSNKHIFDRACIAIANYMRWAGVIGDPVLIASNMAEHLIGNTQSFVVNKALNSKNPENFRMTDELYGVAASDEAVDALNLLKRLFNIGGREAINSFLATDARLNEQEVNLFLDKYYGSGEKTKNDERTLGNKVGEKMKDFTSRGLAGDFLFSKLDSRRFIESIMIIGATYDATDRVALTNSQLMEAYRREGGSEVIRQIMKSSIGMHALVDSTNATFARISPLGELSKEVMRRMPGWSNLLITTYLCKYVDYGINLAQSLLPGSNTMSYLASAVGYKHGRDFTEIQLGGESIITDEELSTENKIILDKEEFWKGFSKCIKYDCAKFGQFFLAGTFIGATFLVLGFDPPDDPMLLNKWDEWKIGRRFALGGTNENGEPQGVAFKEVWWLHDLIGWGAPMAYAGCVLSTTGDLTRANNIFWDGVGDVIHGSTLSQVWDSVINAETYISDMIHAFNDPEATPSNDWMTLPQTTLLSLGAEFIKDLTPRMINSFYRDTMFVGAEARNRSYFVKYKTDGNGNVYTEQVTDPIERTLRKESLSNVVLGLACDALFNHFDPNKTGFMFWEQPVSTTKDPIKSMWRSYFSLEDSYKRDFADENGNISEDAPKKDTEEYTAWVESKVKNLLSLIGDGENAIFKTPEEAAANGFMIPGDMLEAANKYVQKQKTLLDAFLAEEYKAGNMNDFNYSRELELRVQGLKKYFNSVYYDWLYNDDISWSDEGYEQLLTDYETIFYDPNTGEARTYWDYLAGNAEKESIARGDHPTSFILFNPVDLSNRTYNGETVSNWYDPERSDLQRVFDSMQGRQIASGKFEGRDVNNVVFGGYGPFNDSTGYSILEQGLAPSMGQRSYVPKDNVSKRLFKNSVESGSTTGSKNKNSNDSNKAEEKAKYGIPESVNADNVSSEKFNLGFFGYDEEAAAKDLGLDYEQIMADLDALYSGESPTTGGKNTSTWNKNTYSYGRKNRGGSGGGGGSSYNPKIYSNGRVLSFDKAATMYSKQPYSASSNYLRPSFETKGSREAYRREDF